MNFGNIVIMMNKLAQSQETLRSGEQWILDEKGTKILAKGTPVIIFGEPNFKTKPWKELLKSSKANDYSETQLNNEIKPFLEEILTQQKIRAEYLQHKKDSITN